jgi:sigma-B regulation protein RsbU (phosphoserine phosphatase)
MSDSGPDATDSSIAAPLAPDAAPVSAGAFSLVHSAPLDQHLDTLQKEIIQLREEINLLRRRDETLNFYMHRMDEEMRLAARLQQDFLPKALPQIGTVHFHTLFRPAGYVSGDLYDVMRLDEDHVGFYMADAVGHGMPAALLTMFIKNALVTKEITPTVYRLLPPGQTMGRLNDALVSQNLSYATFATAIYGVINTKTLQLSFSRGGHPSPILLRADDTMQNLAGGDGSLLGIFAGEPFADTTVQLQQGDRLFVFTDGIEVAFADEDLKDTQRWREELYNRRHLTTEQLLSEFADHIDKESGSLQPKDDLTIIAVEVL